MDKRVDFCRWGFLFFPRDNHVVACRLPIESWLVGIHVQVDSIGIHRSSGLLFASRRRTVAALWAGAGSNKSHRGACLSFQSCHSICPFAGLVHFFVAFDSVLGALLAAGDCLGSDEVDIRAVEILLVRDLCLVFGW